MGRAQVLFDPVSVFAPSALVQSIHMEDVVVHLERRDGVNNTRALRLLMDVRKRARRAGEPVPELGYPSAVAARPSSSARASSRLSQAEDAILSSTSESGDSDTSLEDLLDEDASQGQGGQHAKLRSLVAETASEAARRACAAASNALTRSRKTSAQTSAAKAKSAATVFFKRGQALKTALAKRVSTRRRATRAEQELIMDGDETRDRSESLASLVEVEEDEEGNVATEEEERESEDAWEGDLGEGEDDRESSRECPSAPDGHGSGARGSGQESADAALQVPQKSLVESKRALLD